MKILFPLCALFLVIGITSDICVGQSIITTGGDVRLVTEPSGNRDDNNGGNTATGALIGRNAGNVDNFMIYDFFNLTPVSGQTVTGAIVNFNVATGFSAGNHGSTLDTINLHEIALGNRGWNQGTGGISGADNVADDGSVSFLNRSQYDPAGVAGTSVPWVDAGGANVANLLGSFTSLGSQAGYNVGAAPAVLSFNVNAATAQGWVDNGLGGIALSVTDDGDTNARFNFQLDAASITFTAVPEPGSGLLFSICGMMMLVRRNRR